jgi:hypothetical protein
MLLRLRVAYLGSKELCRPSRGKQVRVQVSNADAVKFVDADEFENFLIRSPENLLEFEQ